MSSQAIHQKSPEMENCIQSCLDCYRVCTETVAYCLQAGGKHAEANHIQVLLACAEICQTSANFLLLGTPLHTQTCAACAVVCAQCAESCEQMGNDALMNACAEVCRRCAESCRQMVAAV